MRLLVFLFISVCAFADPIHPPLGKKPVLGPTLTQVEIDNTLDLSISKSDLGKALAIQSPVKDQWYRGTCSIFASTAALEALIKRRFDELVDLNENFLQFLVMDRLAEKATEGSSVEYNVPAIRRFGMIPESVWPYELHDWTDKEAPEQEKEKAKALCGDLKGNPAQICLLSHLRPGDRSFYAISRFNREKFKLNKVRYKVIEDVKEIRRLLRRGLPVIVGMEFFYGAWNHGLMEDYKIGKVDLEAWERGEVGTPTEKDVEISRKHEAGHSIVLVGYDDEKKRYYFKNSWGTTDFGVKTDLHPEFDTRGYGEIDYAHVHRFGSVYSLYFR